jgi:hypothetical protein
VQGVSSHGEGELNAKRMKLNSHQDEYVGRVVLVSSGERLSETRLEWEVF